MVQVHIMKLIFIKFKGTIDISDLKVALRALGNEPKKGEIPNLLA